MERIGIVDFLAIAASVLETDAVTITRVVNIPLAESALHAPFAGFGDVEFYPDPIQKAGILCSRLSRNHPIPLDGNKRSAYLSMLMFFDLNGIAWIPPSEYERALAVDALTSGAWTEEEFIDWLREHTKLPE